MKKLTNSDKLNILRDVSEKTGKSIFQLALEEEMVLIGDGSNWDDPIYMINSIITWHVMVALDPSVSPKVHHLIEHIMENVREAYDEGIDTGSSDSVTSNEKEMWWDESLVLQRYKDAGIDPLMYWVNKFKYLNEID